MVRESNILIHDYAKLPEVTLHYVTAGEGEPVLLLHGWPQTWYEWRYVISHLAKHYYVIAPDLRGLGDSTKPLLGYDKKTIANDIWLFLNEHLSIRKVFLVGHDWGGPIAFALSVAHPNEVRRLTIVDTIIPGDGTDNFTGSRWYHAFHWIPDLPESLTQKREQIYLEYFYRNWGARPNVLSDEAISEYLRTYRQPGAMRAGFNYYRAIPQDIADNQAALARGKLKMPVLFITGNKGRARGAKQALEAARRVAEDARCYEIADCGHWIPEEKPEELSQKLIDFFNEDNNSRVDLPNSEERSR